MPSHNMTPEAYAQVMKGLGLSKTAMKFARAHPREARLAMAVALETAAAHYGNETPTDDAITDTLK